MEWSWKTFIPTAAALLVAVQFVASKPLNTQQPSTPAPSEKDEKDRNNSQPDGTGLEYDNYLRQVVEVLESDNEFRKKLETANISDIKSGAIASHLQLVNHSIRTKLDEIKRMEIMRLQQLARLKHRAANTGGRLNRMEIPGHLDLRNPHTFEVKDLEHLILKTTKDLEEVDEKRRKDFKEYEMEKEFEYQQKLKDLPEDQKVKVQEQHEQLQKKHQEHEKIQHPGSKDQFNEVWEKDDKMEDQEFDPKTFFMMHDLNSDLFWDIQEVEAVLQHELDKVYDSKNTPEEDDPVERAEEMNRMREHVFTEIDKDRDMMISVEEFLQYTGKHGENQKFEENNGWETVDEKPAFTDDEFQEYIRQHHPQPGVVPPPVNDDSLQFKPEEQLHLQQQRLQEQVAQQGMPQAVPVQQQQQQQHVAQDGTGQQQPHQGEGQAQQQQQHLPEQGMDGLVPQQGVGDQQGVPPAAQEGAPQQQQQQQQQQQEQVPVQDSVVGQQAKPVEVQHPPQQNHPEVVDQGQAGQGQAADGQPAPVQ